jgi:hypothetical protein
MVSEMTKGHIKVALVSCVRCKDVSDIQGSQVILQYCLPMSTF